MCMRAVKKARISPIRMKAFPQIILALVLSTIEDPVAALY
jgi:hypothetical protein